MEKLLFNLKMRIEAEWGIKVEESTLEVIIHDEQRMKMFKEMGYV